MKRLLTLALCLFITHQCFTVSNDLNTKSQKYLKDVENIIAKNPNATISTFYDQKGGIKDNLIVWAERSKVPPEPEPGMPLFVPNITDSIVREIFDAVKGFYTEAYLTNKSVANSFMSGLLARMKKIKRVK
jgi:hypothetical protein